MSTTTMRPDDDELVADLKRYFAATEVDEPPFRTRVADAVSVRTASTNRRRWMAAGGVGVFAAAFVAVVVPLSSLHGSAPATATTALGTDRGSATSGIARNGSSGSGVEFAPANVPGSAAIGTVAPATGQLGPVGTSAHGPATTPINATPTNGSGAAIVVGTPNGKVERSVTATFTVPAGSFLPSFDNVLNRAVGMGGYVVSSQTSPDGSGRIVAGSVTVKVPSDKLAEFVNGMPSTFTTSAVNFSSVDHTAQYTDLSAQLAAAKAQLTALDQLLAKATSLGDIVSLEQQIAQVQSQVDSYQGQLDVISEQVDLSTATIQLSEAGAAPAPAPSPNPVKDGVSGGWSNAVAVTGAILGGVVTILPLLLLGLMVVAVVVGLRRRRA